MLGNSRCECKCNDGRTRLGIIRGTLIKRVWIQLNDLVLVSLRDYQDDKADIIHKYNSEEEKSLRQYGEIEQLSGTTSTADYIDNSIQESDDLEIDFDDI